MVFIDSDTWSIGYALQAMSYDKDESGFTPRTNEPLPAGYFSPQGFVSQSPFLGFKTAQIFDRNSDVIEDGSHA